MTYTVEKLPPEQRGKPHSICGQIAVQCRSGDSGSQSAWSPRGSSIASQPAARNHEERERGGALTLQASQRLTRRINDAATEELSMTVGCICRSGHSLTEQGWPNMWSEKYHFKVQHCFNWHCAGLDLAGPFVHQSCVCVSLYVVSVLPLLFYVSAPRILNVVRQSFRRRDSPRPHKSHWDSSAVCKLAFIKRITVRYHDLRLKNWDETCIIIFDFALLAFLDHHTCTHQNSMRWRAFHATIVCEFWLSIWQGTNDQVHRVVPNWGLGCQIAIG